MNAANRNTPNNDQLIRQLECLERGLMPCVSGRRIVDSIVVTRNRKMNPQEESTRTHIPSEWVVVFIEEESGPCVMRATHRDELSRCRHVSWHQSGGTKGLYENEYTNFGRIVDSEARRHHGPEPELPLRYFSTQFTPPTPNTSMVTTTRNCSMASRSSSGHHDVDDPPHTLSHHWPLFVRSKPATPYPPPTGIPRTVVLHDFHDKSLESEATTTTSTGSLTEADHDFILPGTSASFSQRPQKNQEFRRGHQKRKMQKKKQLAKVKAKKRAKQLKELKEVLESFFASNGSAQTMHQIYCGAASTGEYLESCNDFEDPDSYFDQVDWEYEMPWVVPPEIVTEGGDFDDMSCVSIPLGLVGCTSAFMESVEPIFVPHDSIERLGSSAFEQEFNPIRLMMLAGGIDPPPGFPALFASLEVNSALIASMLKRLPTPAGFSPLMLNITYGQIRETAVGVYQSEQQPLGPLLLHDGNESMSCDIVARTQRIVVEEICDEVEQKYE